MKYKHDHNCHDNIAFDNIFLQKLEYCSIFHKIVYVLCAKIGVKRLSISNTKVSININRYNF